MSPLRVGLIGAGRWGQVYIQTFALLSDRCRLTHLCTSRPDASAMVGHPVQVTADWGQLIASDCEAVIIATPPQTHAEIVEACLDAGKPCLVEKPLCLDLATAQRLQERIRVSTTPVLVNHTHLFTPAYHALKEHLRRAGEPVRALLSEGMGFGPFRTHTSALWDWGPHDVSLCVDLLGRPPVHVEALGGPCGPDGEPEMVSLRLDFSGELSAWIHCGRLSLEKRRHLAVFTDSRCYVLDDLAAHKLTAGPVPLAKRYTESMSELVERSPLTTGPEEPPMVHVVRYFLDGVVGGDRGRFGADLAFEVTRVLAACERSLAKGRARV